ncbi:MAG: DUF922 domain-containing Zn-dependent protease [Prevotellaceae bacterium]|nr:DUF922 domain-containing Zn-dependent protease [Prevotellaceae bacterium]
MSIPPKDERFKDRWNNVIDKNSASGSTIFSDTKTSDKGHVRNLTIETSDKGIIKSAGILVNAENAAWKQNTPSNAQMYQVRFTGTQNAGAASDGSTKKEYVPKFHGVAQVNGNGVSGTPQEYSWNVKAVYNISDHAPIIEKSQKNENNGTKFNVTFNGSADFGQWKKYSNSPHNFNVNVSDPSQVVIDAVVGYIGDIPGASVGEHGSCESIFNYDYAPQGQIKSVFCDICQKTNKCQYSFKYIGDIFVTSKIIMPNWINKDVVAGPISKTKWQRFWNNLYTHEQGHWDIAVQYAEKSKEWAKSKNGLIYIVEVCCGNNTQLAKQKATKLGNEWSLEFEKKMNEELRKFGSDLKAENSQYDIVTNHGETQGVNFIPPVNAISE